MSNSKSLISVADVNYVAKLAHLDFNEEQKEDMVDKLGSILEYMQQLADIDTTDVAATTHVLPLANVFRDDVVGPTLSNEDALSNAPDREGNFFKVPKIL